MSEVKRIAIEAIDATKKVDAIKAKIEELRADSKKIHDHIEDRERLLNAVMTSENIERAIIDVGGESFLIEVDICRAIVRRLTNLTKISVAVIGDD